jgi:hypothetical protein
MAPLSAASPTQTTASAPKPQMSSNLTETAAPVPAPAPTEQKTTQPSTGSNLTGSNTGNNLAGSNTGNNLAGSNTGNNLAGSSSGDPGTPSCSNKWIQEAIRLNNVERQKVGRTPLQCSEDGVRAAAAWSQTMCRCVLRAKLTSAFHR